MHDFFSLPPSVQAHIAASPLDLHTPTMHRATWAEQLPDASFARLRGYTVLLPLANLDCAHFQARHVFLEAHDPAIVFLLQDVRSHPEAATPMTILVVSVRVRDLQFYVTTVYHSINHAIGFDTWMYKGVQ